MTYTTYTLIFQQKPIQKKLDTHTGMQVEKHEIKETLQ